MPMRAGQPTQYDVVELRGGLDQITPTLSLKAGVLRASQNYEVAPTGGYARVGGYERYDGNARPSDASYQVIQVTSFTNTPTVGQTLTGNTSGATGTIIAVVSASNYMVITQVTGTFTGTEVVKVGATTIGTQTLVTATITSQSYAQYQNLAADVYRALISAVPGSGAIRGVFVYNDLVYAFRDNAGGTSCDLWVSSASGWTQINYKYEVSFTAGGAGTPADGATLTQGGVTATIRRVMDSSGSWAANSAAGRFIIDAPTGGNFAAGAATAGAVAVTLSGVQTAITVNPGGRYNMVTGNFTGTTSTSRVYGADGSNRCFEFDGTTYAPITTGSTPDTPSHVMVNKNHLVAAILSSLVISGTGTPYRYLTTDGGAEIATGDTVTDLLLQPGSQTVGTLAVYCRSNTLMLYGTSVSDWNLVPFNTGAGAIANTAQNMEQSYALDDAGVRSLSTTLNFGNFTQATLTYPIYPFIAAERTKTTCSLVCRTKSQYRIFFSDGYALHMTIVNGKLLGSMPQVFPTGMNCAFSGKLSTGDEVMYAGGNDGYVYQLDKGSSFDGADVNAYMTFNWNSMRSARILKFFRRASVEMQGNYYAAISFGYSLGYGTTELSQPTAQSYTSGFSGAPQWDLFVWDSFIWDGQTISPTEIGLSGTAENIQITISSGTDYIYPYTVNSVITHFTPRRGMR